MFDSEEWPGEKETDVAIFVDPRTEQMGVRILASDQEMDIADLEQSDETLEYDLLRKMTGILEGSKELGNKFPLNCNMHYLNGVSFSKGCYIGQELTQRTFHTGTIRRIAMPFFIASQGFDPMKMRINREDFMPLQHTDLNFEIDLKGEVITAQES